MDSDLARTCARPGCGAAAQATLIFRYGPREVLLTGLSRDAAPNLYDLCDRHATRTRAPRGWAFEDERAPHRALTSPGPSDPAPMPVTATGPQPGGQAEPVNAPASFAPPALGTPDVVAVLAEALGRDAASGQADGPEALSEPEPVPEMVADNDDPGPEGAIPSVPEAAEAGPEPRQLQLAGVGPASDAARAQSW